jgi:hypothetical protein
VKRVLSACLLAVASAACSTPAGDGNVTTCGNAGAQGLASPLLVLEHGEETAALARLTGDCLTETPPDPVLGSDQSLLDAHNAGEAPFVGVNTDGSLRSIVADTLTIGTTFSVYPDHPPSAIPYGIDGVDRDASGNLWVSRDDVNEVAILAPDGSLAGKVDLSSLDPTEGHPDMNGILIVGRYAYVALGFLTHGEDGGIISDLARRPGMIAVIDTVQRQVVNHFDLVGKNPVRKLIPIDGTGTKVIVATPGQHSVVERVTGIDLVDLTAMTATQLVSETAFGVSTTDLGGSIDEVVWAGPTEAYAIALGPGYTNATKVWQFDPSTFDPMLDTVQKTVLAEAPWFNDPTQQGYVHVGLAIDGTTLAVGDHTEGDAAIRLFARPLGTTLSPVATTVEAPWALLTLAP